MTAIVCCFQSGYFSKTMKWYERAKKIIESKGIKQVDIAERIGDTPVNVSRYLNGVRGQDSIDALTRFAAALGVTACYLLTGVDSIEDRSPTDEDTEDSVGDLLLAAREILESNQPIHREALKSNILSFHYALLTEKQNQERISMLEKALKDVLHDKNSANKQDQSALSGNKAM